MLNWLDIALDLLVGFKISPILWKHVSRNTKSSLSAESLSNPIKTSL